MNATPDPAPAARPTKTHSAPSLWLVGLAFIAVVEGAILYGFLQARDAYYQDLRGSCLDECLGTWLGMIFMGALLVFWPAVSLLAGGFVWAIVTTIRLRRSQRR